MKKILLTLILFLPALFSTAQDCNPYVSQGIVSPAPMLPWQYNGTGQCAFLVGNSGSVPINWNSDPNLNIKLVVTLSYGVPNVTPLNGTTAITVISGSSASWFTWSYDVGNNTYTGIQNQTILPVSQGSITIQYKVTQNSPPPPGTPANGFNCNLIPNGACSNPTNDDNVSSYTYTLAKDFGDAPATYGAASHFIDVFPASPHQYICIGDTVDGEFNNQPTTLANGDDNNSTLIPSQDDEDGVTFPPLVRNQNVTIPVVITFNDNWDPDITARLNVWFDWNGDGVFVDAERVSGIPGTGYSVNKPDTPPYSYTRNITFLVPATASVTGPIIARFRLGPGLSALDWATEAAYGEVEDYLVYIQTNTTISLAKSGGATFLPGTTTDYTVTVTNNGNEPANGVNVVDNAPAGTTITNWTVNFPQGGSGTPSGTGNINQIINIAANGTAVYTVTVSVPCNYSSQNLTNQASATAPYTSDPSTKTASWTKSQNVWDGSASAAWDNPDNWSLGVPDATNRGAVIPSGAMPYPVISTAGNQTANLVITNGAKLTIEPAGELRVTNCTEINGQDGLYLKSGPSGNAEFIPGGPVTYPNNGTAQVELYLTSCAGQTSNLRCWHYITSPVIESADYSSSFLPGDKMMQFSETTGAWETYTFSPTVPLDVSKGYAFHSVGDGVRTFHGRLNTGTITTDLLTRTLNLGSGWNLIGNPYSSPIDLDSQAITWSNVEAKVYYLDQGAGNYKVYPANTGYETGARYPLSMQGFFVHVPAGQSSGTVTFTDAARTFLNGPYFYKNTLSNLLKLKVEESSGMNDEIVIGFRDDVTPGYDQKFDCYKAYGDNEAPQLYSVIPEDTKLTINVLPFAGKNTTIPLEFSVAENGTGEYQITASELESFKAGTTITLEDKKINTSQVLTDNPVYTFSYAQGEDQARFLLHFYNPYFGIDEKGGNQDVTIYSNANTIYIKDVTGKDLKGEVYVYNLIGQRIASASLSGGTLQKLNLSLQQGYYIVEVISNDQSYHGNVYLTK